MGWTQQKHFLRGKKAQHKGKEFEKMILNACARDQIACKKTDPPMRTDGHGKIWRERSGVDCILGFQGVAVVCDLKSIDSDRLTHSVLKQHQVDELAHWQARGFEAGYLCWLREIDLIAWVSVSQLLKLQPGESIKPEAMVQLGNSLDFQLGRLFSLHWENPCQYCHRK